MNNIITLAFRELEFGDMGKDVKLIQRILRARGIHDDKGKRCKVTGVLTYQTLFLINKVLESKHMRKKRVVDKETWLAILEV